MTGRLQLPPDASLASFVAGEFRFQGFEKRLSGSNWHCSKSSPSPVRQLPERISSYDDIVDHCCFAWKRLVDQPWRIMSIGLRQWAHGL